MPGLATSVMVMGLSLSEPAKGLPVEQRLLQWVRLALTAELVVSVHDVGRQATILSPTRVACQTVRGQGAPSGNRQPGQVDLTIMPAAVNSRSVSQSGNPTTLVKQPSRVD